MAGESASKLRLDEEVSLRSLRFFTMENDGGGPFVSPVDKELVQAQRRVVEKLESTLGVHVQPLRIHNLRYSFQIWSAMMSSAEEPVRSYILLYTHTVTAGIYPAIYTQSDCRNIPCYIHTQ
ncbi:hypothetical protein FKM82_017544 [Ascaphus truei]